MAVITHATSDSPNFDIIANKNILLTDDTLILTIKIRNCNCCSSNLKITWNSPSIYLDDLTIYGFSAEKTILSPTSCSSKEIVNSNKTFGIGYTNINGDNTDFNEYNIAILKFKATYVGTVDFFYSEDSSGNDAFRTKSPETLSISFVSCLHDNGTKLLYEKKPSCTEDGYTGDVYCINCNNVLEKGEIISKIGHSGGIASCNSKAICSICGEEYGNINSSNHIAETDVINKTEPTVDTSGYSGDTYCTACGTILIKGIRIPNLDKDKKPNDNDSDNDMNNTNNNNYKPNFFTSIYHIIIPFSIVIIALLVVIIVRKKGYKS